MKSRSYTASPISKIQRRDFLKASALGATGLLLGFHLGCKEEEETFSGPIVDFRPNVFSTSTIEAKSSLRLTDLNLGKGFEPACL